MKNLTIYTILFLTIVISVLSTGCGNNEHEDSAKAKVYYCPMHPEVTSNKPSVCPICHMDLVLKGGDGDEMEEQMDGELNLSARGEIIANVATFVVRREAINKNIKAYSYLEFAEQGKKTITARSGGRIEKLFVNQTGMRVNAGDPLFEIYSPELVQAQKEYQIMLRNNERVGNTGLLEASKKRLQLLGLNGKQISALESGGEISYNIVYHSPAAGIVLEKRIQEGVYVNEGTLLFEIAGLSPIWNVAEVFENDLQFLNKGTNVSLTVNAYPGEEFKGKVDFIYPTMESNSGNIKVRSVIDNGNGKLKPGMFGEALFTIPAGEGLIIPASAVIQTGKRNIVWVKSGERSYQGREITLGIKKGDFYEVKSGLKEGEIVASEGGYLLDSESQLRGLTIAGENEILSNDISPVNNDNAIWNEVCPVLGGKVNPKVATVNYKGKSIGFCCAGCDEDFAAEPEKYIGNLSSDGKHFTGE